MASAGGSTLSPAGSSTYSSNTLYVGDGTWDSTKNTFLLPNLQGLNFDTMQYNGMGNRFSSLAEYHVLIQGHGILAAIVFLFILPTSVMIARFGNRSPVYLHIYLNILAVFLTTVVFILGWFAVGPSRSLTNPHHGIGLAIYVLILVQLIGGAWVRRKIRKQRSRRMPIKLMLHQWLGRAIVLLGIVQVPLGLTLYGSPKFTFVLYTLWMTFLLVLYFILSHRSAPDLDGTRHSAAIDEETVVQEKRSGGIGRYILPLVAGVGLAGLLGRRKDKRESRDSRAEVISSRRDSRRDSGSYVEEEKIEENRKQDGIMGKLFAGAAVVGAGALAKSWWDRRQRRKEDEAYSAVAPDTPSRRRRRDDDTVISEDTISIRRTDERRHRPMFSGAVAPAVAGAAIGAAESRPHTPRLSGRPVRNRRESFSSDTESNSPSRREDRRSHIARNTVLGGIGLGWLAKKYKDRKDKQEQDRLDRIREQEYEDERRLESQRRHGNVPPRYTGDGQPGRNHGRRADATDSELTESDLANSRVEPRRGPMPPLAAGALPVAAGVAGAAIAQSRSRHDITEPVPMPPMEPRHFQDSGSDANFSSGGQEHRRHSRHGEEVEAALGGAAVGAAAATVVEEERRRRDRSRASQSAQGDAIVEEERRRREQSRGGQSGQGGQGVASPVSLKVKLGDERVTLRRLNEEEAAEERRTRRSRSRRTRAGSVSSLGTPSGKRRYRRNESARREAAETAAEKEVEAGGSRLSPPRPAFAGGRQPKDSSYYSGAPPPPESLSPGSHGTWSGMSPSATGTGGGEDPRERRRRRRLERNEARAAGTVDYT